MKESALTSPIEQVMPKTASAIDKGIELGWHPGCQICVWWDESVVVNAGIGMASGSYTMRNDSVNLWLSAGKPVGSVAIMLLVQDGLLALDESVAEHWPEFGANGKESITVRHLLTHTAGIRTAEIAARESDLEHANSILAGARLERDWIPGKRAGYHAFSGWQVLAEVVRRVSGNDFATFARERIFAPMLMNSSSFRLTEKDAIALGQRFSPMHSTKNDGSEIDPMFAPEVTSAYTRPGGGLRSTASDMVRFYRTLLEFGELDGVQILRPEIAAQITSPQRTGMKDETFGHVMDWGLGVMFDNKAYGPAAPYGYGPHASARTFGHGGRESSTAFADPEHNLIAAIVFNGMPGELANDRRLRMVTGAIYEDLDLA